MFFSLFKSLYKGTIFTLSEVNNALEKTNEFLSEFNKGQEVKEPLENALDKITMLRLDIISYNLLIPSNCINTALFIKEVDNWISFAQYIINLGIENKYETRELALSFVSLIEKTKIYDITKSDFIDLILEDYPLEIAEKKGYKKNEHVRSNGQFEKRFRVMFVLSYEAEELEKIFQEAICSINITKEKFYNDILDVINEGEKNNDLVDIANKMFTLLELEKI